jgi:hypothetical protein
MIETTHPNCGYHQRPTEKKKKDNAKGENLEKSDLGQRDWILTPNQNTKNGATSRNSRTKGSTKE